MGTLLSLVTQFVADVSQYKNDVDGAKKTTQGMGDTTKAMGAAAAAGFGALIAGGTLAIDKTLEWGGTLDEIMDKTGATSTEAAGLALIQESLGGSTEDLAKSLTMMGKNLVDANGNIGPGGKLMDALGVSYRDANGNIASSSTVLQNLADKLVTMPDGIEKTNIMMQIFGKTGSEMGDFLSLAANGGLSEATAKAQELGLAIDPQGTVDFQMAQDNLNKTMLGLAVSVGGPLLGAITPLLTNMAQLAQKYIPPVIDIVQKNLIPILAVLGTAFIVWAVNAGIAAVATIAAMSPVLIPIALIGAAIALLTAAWINDWGGIRTTLTDVWEKTLKPIFMTIREWIEINLPKAIAWLKDRWEDFIGILAGVRKGFEDIVGAIKTVIDWVSDLIKKLGNIHVPKIFEPGSPTPFEMGLRGIGDTMGKLSDKSIPDFANAFKGLDKSGEGASSEVDYALLARMFASELKKVMG